MILFLRKRAPEPPPVEGASPTEMVMRYAAEGLSEQDIISRMRARGFNDEQIESAVREAIKEEAGGPAPAQEFEPMQEETGVLPTPTMEMIGPPRRPVEMPREEPLPEMQMPQPERPAGLRIIPGLPPLPQLPFQQQRPGPSEYYGIPEEELPPSVAAITEQPPFESGSMPILRRQPLGEPPERVVAPPAPRPADIAPEITLEEIVEGVVADELKKLDERFASFEKRNAQLQDQMTTLSKRIDSLEMGAKKQESNLVTRIEGLGESLTSIEGRIGGVEHIFKEALPQLTEDVRTVAEVVERLKSGR